MSTIKKTCVAIPVGGKVYLPYLEQNLQELRKTDAVIYVGLDEAESVTGLGNYEEVKALCERLATKVLYFPVESYYRPGSIWKKIWDCWKDSNCAYLRAAGYDDIIPANALVTQQRLLEENPLAESCYANMLVQDDDKNTRTLHHTRMSELDKLLRIGSNPFNFVSWLARRDIIINDAFLARTMKGSAAWEWLFHATLLGQKTIYWDSPEQDSPVRRDHTLTLSRQNDITPETERHTYHQNHYDRTAYSVEQAIEDWRSLKMPLYYNAMRLQINPVLALPINAFFAVRRTSKRLRNPQYKKGTAFIYDQ